MKEAKRDISWKKDKGQNKETDRKRKKERMGSEKKQKKEETEER